MCPRRTRPVVNRTVHRIRRFGYFFRPQGRAEGWWVLNTIAFIALVHCIGWLVYFVGSLCMG